MTPALTPIACEHRADEDCFACDTREIAAKLDYVYGATDSPIRTFATGATRDTEDGKLDPEGFLSPIVLLRYCQYMDKHRTQADGTRRDSDNWQKGIPESAYMKSLWRHFMDVWLMYRGFTPDHSDPGYDIEEALCAVLFNASGLLHTYRLAEEG